MIKNMGGAGKKTVLLTGASGSMGSEAFRLLWQMRDRYDIVLLLRPSRKNKKLFRYYERAAGITPFPGPGTARGEGLKIVWGDVQHRDDVEEACEGIDVCLHPAALISPEADRDPEEAWKVNHLGTKSIVEAIEARDPEHIRMVYIGSVAEYGNRMAPVHVGRTGDPVIPSVFDHYALTKISGELEVMQSRIRHRVSLRQTFIMIPDLFSLMDPIMFHQPLNTFMENTTARDSGRLLVSCIEVPSDSGFWGNYYNISGGPACRTTYLEFMERIYGMLGLSLRRVMDRQWFALQNFHMMFYEDAGKLDAFLHHWEGGLSMEDYYREVWRKFPWYLKMTALYNRYVPPWRWMVQAATRDRLRKLALQPHGTLRWKKEKDAGRIRAFFGSSEAMESIPGWEAPLPSLDHNLPHIKLDHGYDESKETLDTEDLRFAAECRGGSLVYGRDTRETAGKGRTEGGSESGPGRTSVSKEVAGTFGTEEGGDWNGDMDALLTWRCGRGHTFRMTPHAVLKGGHWCMECISPPWAYDEVAAVNPFAAQVLNPGDTLPQ
jgi:nucleoside-diphosphate-sugar epimerase